MVFSTDHRFLMEKFNLSIDQLDYKYIENCQNVKQLERILRVLRSGEEGIFPHLLKFCEDKLRHVDPCNKLLIVAEKVKRYSELPEAEKKEILADMEDWSREVSKYKIQNTVKECDIAKELPPIRNQNASMSHNENKTEIIEKNTISNAAGTKLERSKPRSYEEWDKYNVDEELKKLDNEDNEPVNTMDINKRDISELSKSVSLTNLSQMECEKVSNLERMKGNEAYKAQDYEEAATYYTRSLSAFKTAKSLNNRAQAYIKLKMYFEAVLDCNEVISMEPNNVKALYRRGTAHKEAKMFDLAMIDYSILLEMEPDNTSAKEQLQDIEKLRLQETQENNKVIIEELETDSYTQETSTETQLQSDENNVSKRIIIEEVTDVTHRSILDEICNCNDDTDQAFSKNTREMFSLVQNSKIGKSKTVKLIQTYKDMRNASRDLIPVSSKKLCNDTKSGIDSKYNRKIKEDGINEKPEKLSSKSSNKNTLIQNKTDEDNSKPILTYEKEQEYPSVNCKVKQEREDTKEFKIKTKEYLDNFDIGRILTETKITPFKFIHAWLSCNGNYNPRNGAVCLLTIQPNELPQLISNKLDGPLLNGMLMAINSINKMGKIEEGMDYLNNLIKVPRIKMISLFLSEEEKKNVKAMLIFMEKNLNIHLSQIRKVLTIV